MPHYNARPFSLAPADMISFAALGIGVTDEAAREASHAVDTAGGMLSALFPALMTAWQCGVEEVAMPLMPFMTAYVTRLKTLAKRCVQEGPPVIF